MDPTVDRTRKVRGSAPSERGAALTLDVSPLRAGPADVERAVEREIRGRLFQELDLLAFALEMEAAEALGRGEEDAAARAQQTRLGIRLAQRLAGGVPAPEVELRLRRWRAEYLAKFPA